MAFTQVLPSFLQCLCAHLPSFFPLYSLMTFGPRMEQQPFLPSVGLFRERCSICRQLEHCSSVPFLHFPFFLLPQTPYLSSIVPSSFTWIIPVNLVTSSGYAQLCSSALTVHPSRILFLTLCPESASTFHSVWTL